MIDYRISLYQPSRNRLKVTVTFPTPKDETKLLMSAWRPGRYEEGNFTSLVSHLQCFDENKGRIQCRKSGKNEWTADTNNTESITITYLYYASVLTAGNTYLDDSLLLVNPVNLLIYNEIIYDEQISLKLDIPKEWIVSGLEHQENKLFFNGIDRLFDSPFIASNGIKTLKYEIEETQFYIHLLGENTVDNEKLIEDFQAFTTSQIQAFGSFPVNCFSFVLIGTPLFYLHGVEHLNNTIIVLGPSFTWHNVRYLDLLHVSSHELYHVWNIKSIRPAELMPYRFQNLSYSSLGYVYEGVTTFMGDYHLLKSNVITTNQYLELLCKLVQTHIDNPGRHSMSLSDSSIDTWVDGYVAGTPGKKVSIYNEGALVAFYLDFRIREASNNRSSLDTFMQQLYNQFGQRNQGYQEHHLVKLLQDISGVDFTAFFSQYIHMPNGYESILTDAFAYYGIEFKSIENPSISSKEIGIKTFESNGKTIILSIASGSPADIGGLSEKDIILKLNEVEINKNMDEILSGRIDNEVRILINRNGNEREFSLPVLQKSFYPIAALSFIVTETQQTQKNRSIFGFKL